MKAIINVILLGTLLLLAFLYLKSEEAPKQKPLKRIQSSQSNQSQSIDNQVEAKANKKNDKEEVKKDQYSSVFINFKGKQKSSSDDDSDLDYVTAYREWQYFSNCYTDVEDFHSETDPLQTLGERFDSNTRESQEEATQLQKTYYELHVQECKRLIEDESDDYYTIMSKLKQKFESIEAETDQAKDLQHALEMAEQLERFKFEYSKVNRGQMSNSSDEAKAIQKQIDQYSNEILYLYDSNDQLSESQVQQIDILSNQIENLRQKQVQTRVVDQEALKVASDRLDGYINSIDDFLVKNQSPDAFLILARAIYYVEYFSKESTILKQLKYELAIYDAYFINLLNQVVVPMVACSMGYPCDARSELVVSHCLGLRDSMFIQACDNSLIDFYYNYYIGPNQRADVNLYFNYLKQKYAY